MTTDKYLFLFAKQTNPNQSNGRSTVPPLVFPGKTLPSSSPVENYLNYLPSREDTPALKSYYVTMDSVTRYSVTRDSVTRDSVTRYSVTRDSVTRDCH